MSINWTITETKKENLIDGDYIVELKNIEEKMDKYGTYIQIEERIEDPSEYEGRMEYERFYVGAYDQQRKERAVYSFSKYCKQISGLKTGEVTTNAHLLGKRYIKTIKNAISENNGQIYQNTINRILVPTTNKTSNPTPTNNSVNTVTYGGISIPQTPSNSAQPLNDEVPF